MTMGKTLHAALRHFSVTQLVIYGAVGVGALSCELLSFHLLRSSGFALIYANTLARCLGGVLAFAANRLFTFAREEHDRRPLRTEALRYLMLFVVLTFLSGASLSFVTKVFFVVKASGIETLTKFFVEVLVVALGFVVQKFWVFRPKPSPGPRDCGGTPTNE